MTKSRTAPFRILIGAAAFPASLSAQTMDPQAWIDAQRSELRDALRLDCSPAGDDEEEIVVCGSRDEDWRQRLPLSVEHPPEAASQAGGEQRAALEIDSSRCTTVGRDQQCGMLDILGIAVAVGKAIVERVAEGE